MEIAYVTLFGIFGIIWEFAIPTPFGFYLTFGEIFSKWLKQGNQTFRTWIRRDGGKYWNPISIRGVPRIVPGGLQTPSRGWLKPPIFEVERGAMKCNILVNNCKKVIQTNRIFCENDSTITDFGDFIENILGSK